MRQILMSIGVLLLIGLTGSSLVIAKSVNSNSNAQAKNQEAEVSDVSPSPSGTPVPSATPSDTDSDSESNSVQVRNSIRKLEKLESQITIPEIKTEVGEVADTNEQEQEAIDQKLEKMEARPGLLKFILGPDYKNAGQVRSSIVRLQALEGQMTRIRERLNDPVDIQTINDAIASVQSDIASFKALLDTKLTGFSLFGWLAKFLSGYSTPTPTPSPSASATPTASPTVTPTVSPSPTATP